MGAGSNGITFDDLESTLTLVSRSRYTYNNNNKLKILRTNLV